MAAGAVPQGYALTPYCGAPPSTATLVERWNLDPILLVALLAALIGYMALSRSASGWRRACFCAGWTLAALALVSPLCPLSVSLFSARVGQHMLLASVAAPLVALGFETRGRASPLAAAVAFAIALWVWHAPGPYAATFRSDLAYWAMHLSVFASACWLWSGLLDPRGRHVAASLAAAALTTAQMGFLGAVITFAQRPLYAVHALTTSAWGLTPLEDQQLGGVIMWVPAGLLLVGAVVVSLARAMARSEARVLARPV